MIDVFGETVGIWIFLFIDIIFLLLRFRLRCRKNKTHSLKVSDFLITLAFLFIFTESIINTIMNEKEIRFYHEEPFFPDNLDPVSTPLIGYPLPAKMYYLKILYILLHFNTVALYTVKATLLAFFYEIFPKKLRIILHLTTGIVTLLFLSSFFTTLFWCWPHTRMWAPVNWNQSAPNGFCVMKLSQPYNKIIFGAHISSTIIVIILPSLLLPRVNWKKREVIFALTTLFFGSISVLASTLSFLTVLKLSRHPNNKFARHASILSAAADQNAIFWAACLSVLRLTRREICRKGDNEDDEEVENKEGGGLVIRVERRFSVQVDIVEAWGHDWTDPWQELRMREESRVTESRDDSSTNHSAEDLSENYAS
ncbi:hypothetical protein BZA77DRAFT_303139 [Pyronema omphalodes]|nr:hypothetical protein BZA77DRAFT_303139 [Pyronema omphalodes]